MVSRAAKTTTLMSKAGKTDLKPPGFTLLEVLVAVVITGTVVTVFFQILSAGMRLEFRAQERTAEVLKVSQVYQDLLARDCREDDFVWQQESGDQTWKLRVEEVETVEMNSQGEDPLNLDSELYRYVFEYTGPSGRTWTLTRLVRHDPGFFSEDFKRDHFN